MILTNCASRVSCKPEPNERISDHETIVLNVLCDKKIDYSLEHTVISWRDYTKEKLVNNLRHCEWNNFLNMNLNEKILKLRNNLEKAVQPLIKKRQN